MRGLWPLLIPGLMAPAASHAAAPSCPRVEFAEVFPSASAATRAVTVRPDRTIQVSRVPITTLADIAAARLDESRAHSAVLVTFTPEAAARLETVTASRPDFPVAFVVDDEALLSVVVEGGYGIGPEGVQLSLADPASARRLAATLGRCLAPAPGR